MATSADHLASPLHRSPLHQRHEELGAKFGAFGGWSMPLDYPTGVVKEHTSVREAVGVFDVSHLGKVLVSGPGRRGVRERDPDQRPRPDRGGAGAVHVVLRRGHRRHRRRPDRLPAGRRGRAAGAQRRQRRRGGAQALGLGPGRGAGRRPAHRATPCWPCRAPPPTSCSAPSAYRPGTPTCRSWRPGGARNRSRPSWCAAPATPASAATSWSWAASGRWRSGTP